MNKKAFESIKRGVEDAIRYLNGDKSGCIEHTPEEIKKRKKERDGRPKRSNK